MSTAKLKVEKGNRSTSGLPYQCIEVYKAKRFLFVSCSSFRSEETGSFFFFFFFTRGESQSFRQYDTIKTIPLATYRSDTLKYDSVQD